MKAIQLFCRARNDGQTFNTGQRRIQTEKERGGLVGCVPTQFASVQPRSIAAQCHTIGFTVKPACISMVPSNLPTKQLLNPRRDVRQLVHKLCYNGKVYNFKRY